MNKHWEVLQEGGVLFDRIGQLVKERITSTGEVPKKILLDPKAYALLLSYIAAVASADQESEKDPQELLNAEQKLEINFDDHQILVETDEQREPNGILLVS